MTQIHYLLRPVPYIHSETAVAAVPPERDVMTDNVAHVVVRYVDHDQQPRP